MPVRH